MAELVGRTLGKYRIDSILGQGGMAIIYRAYHPRLERFVAIKVLHDHLVQGQPDFLARFEREARAIASLHHPNIIQVFDFDVEENLCYMVMELVDGVNLNQRLEEVASRGDHLALVETGRIIHQVADALDYAHQHGVLHRDIKPSNVLLDMNNRVILTDFGIARLVDGTRLTATSTLVGTPAYMSPEQCQGLPLTGASDLYALGIVLFEMVAGQVPFDADTPFALMMMQVQNPLPPLSSLRKDLPPALEQVLQKALAKRPEDRYQRARDMQRAVEQAVELTRRPWPEDYSPRTRTKAVAAERVVSPAATRVSPGETRVAAPRAARLPASPPAARVPPPVVPLPVYQPYAPDAPPAGRGGLPTAWWVAGLGFLVILALMVVLILVANTPPGPQLAPTIAPGGSITSCVTPETCADQVQQRTRARDLNGALGIFNQFQGLVQVNARPQYARIPCAIGDLAFELGNNSVATQNYTTCRDWTGGQQPLFDYANQQLKKIPGQ